MVYKASPVGNEISCVFHGVEAGLLNDYSRLEKIFTEALEQDKFSVLGRLDNKFTPKGYSIVALLGESQAGIHTFPEYGSMHFGIYTCRAPGDGKRTFEYLKRELNPEYIGDYFERSVRVAQDRELELQGSVFGRFDPEIGKVIELDRKAIRNL